MAKKMGTEEEIKNPSLNRVKLFLKKEPQFKHYINSLPTIKEKIDWIDGYNKSLADKKWYRERKGMATEGGLPFSSESILPRQNKGGLAKKPTFRNGGSYKGKQHKYAAGGMVKELKI